jgi:hypothetical protein
VVRSNSVGARTQTKAVNRMTEVRHTKFGVVADRDRDGIVFVMTTLFLGAQQSQTRQWRVTHASDYCLKPKPDKLRQGSIRNLTTFQIVGRRHMMMKSTVAAAILLSLAFGTGAALAQNPPPASEQAAPAAGMDKKKSISKACSAQADAKGLHGKARKKFRSACKRHGGKAE